jgi:hypothetical protein
MPLCLCWLCVRKHRFTSVRSLLGGWRSAAGVGETYVYARKIELPGRNWIAFMTIPILGERADSSRWS